MEARDEYLQRVVKGKTFADLGGIYGTVQERVSVARGFGATAVTMIDVLPPLDQHWKAFEARLAALGITDCQTISGDILTLRAGPFDVTHSSGILYHMPNPVEYLTALHRLTNEHCIMTSAICPPSVTNRFGTLEIPKGGGLFVPGMTAEQKTIYTEFYTGGLQAILGGINVENEASVFLPGNYVPWWWLLPADTIASMCRSAGFTVVAEAPNWAGKAHTFLLRSTGVRDVAPRG